jgi:formate dehydrogenase major subunit
MPQITLTINGRKVSGEMGDTILEVCQKAAIDVPTLCHYDCISDIGSCRMCLVEVARQQALQPACTFPASEGMDVETESERVVEARKFMLQLLFSERNHFCMYCQMSGDCELQDLAYRYGLDHWVYDRAFPKLEVDSSHQYYVMDHNRCILCRRCVRVCAELVGNHTLGVQGRGVNARICADLDQPRAESSCISCGTCVQVCPTGALLDRKSAYLGLPEETETVKSTCTFCSVGCGVELITCYNNLIRIEGDWDAAPNGGLLCDKGRFEPLNEPRARVKTPMVRRNGVLTEVEWEEALRFAADGIHTHEGKPAVLTSARLTNEAMSVVVRLFREGLGADVGSLTPVPERLARLEGDLATLDQADLIVVMGADLTLDHQVAGFLIKRSVANRGARLIIVDGDANGLAPYASYQLEPGESARVIALCSAASAPVVIYGAGATTDLLQLRRALAGKAHFLGLAPGVNSRGAVAAGIHGSTGCEEAEGFYILAGDEQVDEELLKQLEGAGFVAVHSSYYTRLTECADVVLPVANWSEKAGHFTNTEGHILEVARAVDPPSAARSDEEILEALAAELEVTL